MVAQWEKINADQKKVEDEVGPPKEHPTWQEATDRSSSGYWCTTTTRSGVLKYFYRKAKQCR